MMRSPKFMAVAVRRANGRMVIRSHRVTSVAERFWLFKKPIVRGVVTLIESMVNGIGALSFSAQIASEDEVAVENVKSDASAVKAEKVEALSSTAIAMSMFTAFALGIGLFVALPHGLAAIATGQLGITADSPLFHLLDGLFKLIILLTYVYLIGQLPDIFRVFQYHGAEHQSIYAFEKNLDLTVDNADQQIPLHPRCGTSFLFFLVLISVIVFSIALPVLGLTHLSENKWLNHVAMVLVKIGLMLPVAGLSYEFIKACAFRMDQVVFRAMIWPGMMLQKLTTRKPDRNQLEVALASLKQVLRLEKTPAEQVTDETLKDFEIGSIAELTPVNAAVREFLEN